MCLQLTHIQNSMISALDKHTALGRVYMENMADNENNPIRYRFMYGKVTIQGDEAMKNALKNIREAPSAAAFIFAVQADQR